MGGSVETVLVELPVVPDGRCLICKLRFSGVEHEGGVLARAVPFRIDLEQGNVVVAVIVFVGNRQAGEVKYVDAAAVALRDVCLNVDAGKKAHILLVNGVIIVIVFTVIQVRAKFHQCVHVLLGEFRSEVEIQPAGAVIYGNAVCDDGGAVGDIVGCHGVAPVKGVQEFIYIDVLDDSLLAVIGTGNGVGGKIKVEGNGLGILSEINGVKGGNKGEGRAPCGEAEDIIPDGAYGKMGIRVTGKVLRELHLDLLKGKLLRIGAVYKVFVHQAFPKAVVHLDAGGAKEPRRKQGEKDYALLHFRISS